jgi:hypothetical protein
MDVFRAPIHTEHIVMGQEPDKRPKTRSGYLVPEAYSCYEKALGEVGTSASGRALHFAADIVCSGGIDIWIRGAYSYAVQRIGLANPRIFVYLKQRISELDKRAATLPQEQFYSHPEVQNNIAECVLVLQLCPKRAKLVWPKIDVNTKRPGWLRGVAGAPETRITRTIWTSDADTPPLYLVSNELCKAIQEGSQERALFWIRWVMEEDARIRKETKGHGLSTKERGGATSSGKAKSDAGHFVASVLYELYKELSTKNLIRMNEEFSELYRLWRGSEVRMATNLRRDCLGLMAIICCEVPRWKVPAAPSLVADPIRLSRAVAQCGSFFNEVLANPMAAEKQIKASMTKAAKQRTTAALSEKEVKELSMEEKFSEYDAAMEAYLKKF